MLKKIRRHGLKRSMLLAFTKVRSMLRSFYWRWHVKRGSAHTTECRLFKLFGKTTEELFDTGSSSAAFLAQSVDKPGHDQLMLVADSALHNRFEVLGYGFVVMPKMRWHEDVYATKRGAGGMFAQHAFYKDIVVHTFHEQVLAKDIKVPWEISRFQYCPALGYAYAMTDDDTYRGAFEQLVADWCAQNSFMRGVNWLNPMEVAIRAINWIRALSFFGDRVGPKIKKIMACSLYDHLVFLEQNWETYDGKTNNHYLSNLVGYLYLCLFFKGSCHIERKIRWCEKELVKEINKQILPDGTSYEGSTAYHSLVLELCEHALLLAQELKLNELLFVLKSILPGMRSFVWWCTDNSGRLIMIGDDDSGQICLPALSSLQENFSVPPKEHAIFFPSFGLAVVKSNSLHLTLRHPRCMKKQPTGHFHNDVGSIALSINNIPLIVDPGSYVYTPSSYWRNYFRSAHAHSMFFMTEEEPVPFDDRLFALEIAQADEQSQQAISHGNFLHCSHELYRRYGVRAERKVVASDEKSLALIDRWSLFIGADKKDIRTTWQLVLAPEIVPQYINSAWELWHATKPVARIMTHLDLHVEDTWYAPVYGSKVACKKLVAVFTVQPGQEFGAELIL